MSLGGMEGDSILRPIRSVNHPYDYILLDVKDSVISFSQARNSLTADPVKVEYDAESGTATFEVTFYNKQKTNFQGTAGLYVRDPNLSIDDYSWEVNNWLGRQNIYRTRRRKRAGFHQLLILIFHPLP